MLSVFLPGLQEISTLYESLSSHPRIGKYRIRKYFLRVRGSGILNYGSKSGSVREINYVYGPVSYLGILVAIVRIRIIFFTNPDPRIRNSELRFREGKLTTNPPFLDPKLCLISSLGRYVFGSEISYNKPPPRLPGLGC